jgi:hypothetical protein
MEDQRNRFIARQGIHLFSIDMIPLRERKTSGTHFSIDMVSLTGNE